MSTLSSVDTADLMGLKYIRFIGATGTAPLMICLIIAGDIMLSGVVYSIDLIAGDCFTTVGTGGQIITPDDMITGGFSKGCFAGLTDTGDIACCMLTHIDSLAAGDAMRPVIDIIIFPIKGKVVEPTNHDLGITHEFGFACAGTTVGSIAPC